MPNASDLYQPLLPGLKPVPALQPGICPVCRTGVKAGFSKCYPCRESSLSVVPISLSIHGELLHHHLRHYKDNPRSSVREEFTLRLAGLLELFLHYHASCLGGSIERVATVPSSRRDAPWAIVSRLQRFSGQSNPLFYNHRTKGFSVTANLRDLRILLLDDTFTSGQSLLLAHQTLIKAHAVVIGPVVLGRHVRPDYIPSKPMLECVRSAKWHPRRCCRCAGIVCDPPLRNAATSPAALFDY